MNRGTCNSAPDTGWLAVACVKRVHRVSHAARPYGLVYTFSSGSTAIAESYSVLAFIYFGSHVYTETNVERRSEYGHIQCVWKIYVTMKGRES